MAVIDSHGNTPSESSVKAEENPQTLSSPEPGATAKRKNKRKKINEGSNEQFQAEVCPKPLLDSPFSQEGNVEAAADNASPNPKKKKKKIKNVHGEKQLQASGHSIAVCVDSDDTKGEGAQQGDANGNGDLRPKPLLDTPVSIVSHEENSEATALNPEATPKKKRKKKILQAAAETCDPSIRIGVEPDVTKDEGSREVDVNDNGGLYPKPLVDTPVPIVSHEENAEATVLNPGATLKKKRKKKILQGAEEIHDHSIRKGVEPDVTKDEGSREGDVNENEGLCPEPLLDTKIPIVYREENAEATVLNPGATLKKKRKKKILQGAEEIHDHSIRKGVEPDVTKDEGSREGDVNENEGLCPEPLLDTKIPIVYREENAEETARNPSPTPKRKRKKKILQGDEEKCEPSIRIGVEPDVKKDERSQEGDDNKNEGLCPKPLLDTPIPIVSHEEKAEGSAQSPSPTPKKKKKKRILQGADQICDPSIQTGLEPDVGKDEGSPEGDVNESGGLCPEPLLDSKIPIVSNEEDAEGTARNPSQTPKRKRKKKILQGAEEKCEPSILIGVEPDVKKDEGSREGDVNKNEGLCPTPLLDTPIPIVSHEEKAEGTAQSPIPTPKKKRKKNILQGADQVCEPSVQIDLEHDVAKDEGSREGGVNENGGLCPDPLLDTKSPIVFHEENGEGTVRVPSPTPKRKRKKKILQGVEEKCEGSIRIGVEPDVKKDEGSREGDVNENEGFCPTPLLDTPIPIVSHEEKAEGTAQSPSPTPKKKKKKNKKKILLGADQICDPSIQIGLEPDVAKDEGSQEGDVNENVGLCPEPLLETKIPIVSHEENAEGTARNPSPTPKRKRKKKILQGVEEKCEGSIQIGVEPDVKKDEGSREGDVNENEGFCPTPLLDTPIPIVSHEEKAEGTAQSPSPTPKKKKKNKKKILPGADQICDPSIQIGLEPDVAKDEGSQEGDVNENVGLCPEPLLETKIPIVSHEENAEGTARNPSPTPKRKRKKKILEGVEEKCEASIQIGVEPDVKKDEGSREGDVNSDEGFGPTPLLDTPIPIVSHEEKAEGTAQRPSPTPKKKKKKVLQGADQICDPSIQIGLEPDVAKDERSQEGGTKFAECFVCHQQGHLSKNCPINSHGIYPKGGCCKICGGVTHLAKDCPDKGWRGSVAANGPAGRFRGKIEECPGPEGAESSDGKPPETAVALSIVPKIPDQASPNDTATPIDQDQKVSEKKRKSNPVAAPSIEPTIQTGQDPPVDPATPVDPEQMVKKKSKESNSALKNDGLESEKRNADLRKSNPVAAPSTEPTIQTGQDPPVDPATPVDPEQMTKKSKESNSALKNDGLESEKCNADLRNSNPVAAPSTEPTIQTGQDPPVDPATPVDPEQMTKKKSKESNSALKNDGLESDKRNADLRKSNPVAAPSTEPTIQTGQDPPVDPATPVDPEQMKKKKGKQSNSAPKNDVLESEKRNADLTAETSVQKIEGPTAKKSMGRRNPERAARYKFTESPSLSIHYGGSSLSCEACQGTGHRLEQCKRLRRLSKDEEVCFFCGEIGHSLGKCGVSQAGGRFAKCLLCHQHGHFGYNCPQSEHEKKPKELVANGAISGSEIRFDKCSLCHKRGHRSRNCPQNGHDPKVMKHLDMDISAVETEGQPLPEV